MLFPNLASLVNKTNINYQTQQQNPNSKHEQQFEQAPTLCMHYDSNYAFHNNALSKHIIAMNFSYLFKYIVIGDQSVGKSSIVMQFIDSSFRHDSEPTVGVEFASKTITIDRQLIKLQIWDTAGQEAFQSITRSYYRGTIGAVLVYDVTSRRSFQNTNKWLQETRNYATNDNVVVMLVANKVDMKLDREVSKNEGLACAEQNGLLFTECSAKTNVNVHVVFERLSEEILRRIKNGEIDVSDENGGVRLGNYKKQQQSQPQKKCC